MKLYHLNYGEAKFVSTGEGKNCINLEVKYPVDGETYIVHCDINGYSSYSKTQEVFLERPSFLETHRVSDLKVGDMVFDRMSGEIKEVFECYNHGDYCDFEIMDGRIGTQFDKRGFRKFFLEPVIFREAYKTDGLFNELIKCSELMLDSHIRLNAVRHILETWGVFPSDNAIAAHINSNSEPLTTLLNNTVLPFGASPKMILNIIEETL